MECHGDYPLCTVHCDAGTLLLCSRSLHTAHQPSLLLVLERKEGPPPPHSPLAWLVHACPTGNLPGQSTPVGGPAVVCRRHRHVDSSSQASLALSSSSVNGRIRIAASASPHPHRRIRPARPPDIARLLPPRSPARKSERGRLRHDRSTRGPDRQTRALFLPLLALRSAPRPLARHGSSCPRRERIAYRHRQSPQSTAQDRRQAGCCLYDHGQLPRAPWHPSLLGALVRPVAHVLNISASRAGCRRVRAGQDHLYQHAVLHHHQELCRSQAPPPEAG